MKITLFISILFLTVGTSIAKKKIVCYHGTWSTYRHSVGKFDVSNINPFLCTHLVYAFFGIEEDGSLRVIDPYLDLEENWGRGNIKKFNELKQINPKLKTLAAVGGWNEGSIKFSEMSKEFVKRQRFINTTIDFILKHGFDGLDLDWEYPGQRGGDLQIDKRNYNILVKELKEKLKKYNLILSAAVAAVQSSVDLSYNISEISKHLDFINVMSYDLHGSWDSKVGINSPLYPSSADVTQKEKQLNIDAIVAYWLQQGAPAEKLVIGLPAYGRTFSLLDSSDFNVGAIAIGPGSPGRYTNEPGMIGYNELCEQFNKEFGWLKMWQQQQSVPYAVKGNQWIGYDNQFSVKLKSQYVLCKNLGGIMLWSVETDDFRNICGYGSFPLLTTINQVLNEGDTGNCTTNSTITTPSANSTTTASPANSTTTLQPTNSTTTRPPTNSTTTLSPTNSTTTLSPTNSTTTRPPTNSTTALPPTNSTTTRPPTNSTTALPPTNSTTTRPPTNTTTALPPTNSTTTRPPTNSTTALPPTNSTTTRPPTNSTTALPPTNSTTTRPPTNSTTTPTTPIPLPPNKCKEDGTFRDENDCSRFYVCIFGIRYDFQCPSNLLFDDELKTCNYPNLVNC